MIFAEVGIALFALGATIRLGRRLLGGTSIQPQPFGEAFRRELFADPERARELATRAQRSWVGRLSTVALEALDAARDVGLEMAAEYKHIRQDAYQALKLLRQIARGMVFVGLLFAMAEVLWARFGSHDLSALMAGVAEAEAESRAIIAVAIGFACAAVLLAARRRLRRVVRDTLQACDKFRERLENQVQKQLDEGWTLEPTE